MLIIPTPQEAETYAEIVESDPELKPVLSMIIDRIEQSKGRGTWVDQNSVPSKLFSKIRKLLALKHWLIEYGFNQEENYHYYSIEPCKCACCAARQA